MKRLRLGTLVVSLLTALIVVGPAQASAPANVDVLGCAIFQDGNVTVNSHSYVNLQFGWATKARRQGRKFLEVAHVLVAKIDRAPIPDPDHYWARPVKYGNQFWATFWSYPAGHLARGESIAVKLPIDILERVWDATGWYEAGHLFDRTLECRITAS